MMAKSIFGDAQHFDAAFEAVANELVYARVYFDGFKKLDESFEEYAYEIRQARSF